MLYTLKVTNLPSGTTGITRCWWIILLLVFFLLGCVGQQVCRHKVLSHYAVAIEKNVPARILVYKVDLSLGIAHAQVQIQRNGKWIYYQEIMGFLIETDMPEFSQDGFVFWFTGEEYLKVLKMGQYHEKVE